MLLINHRSSAIIEFQTQNSFDKTKVQAQMQDMNTIQQQNTNSRILDKK